MWLQHTQLESPVAKGLLPGTVGCACCSKRCRLDGPPNRSLGWATVKLADWCVTVRAAAAVAPSRCSTRDMRLLYCSSRECLCFRRASCWLPPAPPKGLHHSCSALALQGHQQRRAASAGAPAVPTHLGGGQSMQPLCYKNCTQQLQMSLNE